MNNNTPGKDNITFDPVKKKKCWKKREEKELETTENDYFMSIINLTHQTSSRC